MAIIGRHKLKYKGINPKPRKWHKPSSKPKRKQGKPHYAKRRG